MRHYQNINFLLSAAALQQLPPDRGMEIALAGYSNVGKSSILNNIANRKSIAYMSKTPGRTQHINVFTVDPQRRLIDLPGYGYAKIAYRIKRCWQNMLDEYLHIRSSLKGILLIIDSRHLMKPLDQILLKYCIEKHLPIHILLNKVDKLNATEKSQNTAKMQLMLSPYAPHISQQYFSATQHFGLKQLYAILNLWYCF